MARSYNFHLNNILLLYTFMHLLTVTAIVDWDSIHKPEYNLFQNYTTIPTPHMIISDSQFSMCDSIIKFLEKLMIIQKLVTQFCSSLSHPLDYVDDMD